MFTNVWNTHWRNGRNCRCCLPNFRIRGDRQLKHQPKRITSLSSLFRHPYQLAYPLLSMHSRVRDMTLSITLQKFTLGATTKESTLIPQLHTLQNHPHPSNCPHPSTTHLNHTYPPTTHIPSNHPHLMPVHLVQMNTLEQDDPDTWKALMSTNFVVVKLNILFTYLFTDHTLAQDVNMLKRHSWMVGVKMELL